MEEDLRSGIETLKDIAEGAVPPEISIEEAKAILKRYKELEEENERLIIAKAEALQEMRKYKAKYENLKIRHNGTKEALRIAEDLEKQYSQEASNLEAELDNSIPISVIQNTLKEIDNRNYNDYTNNQDGNEVKNNILKDIQELLEEGGSKCKKNGKQ